MMLARCVSAVLTLIPSIAATSLLLWPSGQLLQDFSLTHSGTTKRQSQSWEESCVSAAQRPTHSSQAWRCPSRQYPAYAVRPWRWLLDPWQLPHRFPSPDEMTEKL